MYHRKKKQKQLQDSKPRSEASQANRLSLFLDHGTNLPWSGGEMSGAPVHRALDKLHSFVPEATLYLLGRNLPNEVERFLTVLRPRVAPRTKGLPR